MQEFTHNYWEETERMVKALPRDGRHTARIGAEYINKGAPSGISCSSNSLSRVGVEIVIDCINVSFFLNKIKFFSIT